MKPPAGNPDGPRNMAPDVCIGHGTRIDVFVNLYGCTIGSDCRIGSFVEIGKGVVIGNSCRIGSHSYLCDGVILGDGVQLGNSVSFINDRYPRATNADGSPQTGADWSVVPTRVGDGAMIGTGSTLLCGITVGGNAIVGAGSVVTRDVEAGSTVAGVPARTVRRPVGR